MAARVQDMITKAKAFKPSQVTYKPATVNKRGGKNVQLQLNGQPIVIQFPLMMTWGVNERVDDDSGKVSYDLALQFKANQSRSEDAFRAALAELNEKVLDDAVRNSKEWFGKSKTSKAVLTELMYPILKYPKDKATGELDYTRDPTLKLKVPYWDGKFTCELYDMNKAPLYVPQRNSLDAGPQGDKTPVDFIPKASHVRGLLQCTGLWFAGGRFGVTWKLVQAAVRPPLRLVGAGKCHIEDDSDDEEIAEQIEKQEAESKDNGPSFDSEDDDDSEEEETVVAPEPAPKKKKVVRRRKKKGDA